VAITGLSSGQTVSGLLNDVQALPSGATIDRVEFRLDGTLLLTERSAPYCVARDSGIPTDPCYPWDTRRLSDGPHVLRATAFDTTGRSTFAEVAFTIANPTPTPTPTSTRLLWDAPTSGPAVAEYNVYISTDGTTFSLAGVSTTTEIPLSMLGLMPGAAYYTYVTSVGEAGLESAPSEIISFQY